MSQRVPEFALVVGVFLGLSLFLAGALLTDDLLRSLLSSVLVCYPFVGYAVFTSPDPTTVLRPRATLAVGVLLGLAAAVGGALSGPLPGSAVFGLFLFLVVSLPAVAYVVRYAPPRPPVAPGRVVAAAAGVGVVVAAGGLLAGEGFFGAASGVLVALSGAVYAHRVGFRPGRRRRDRVVAACALTGVAAVLGGVLVTGGVDEWVALPIGLVLAPALYAALTR